MGWADGTLIFDAACKSVLAMEISDDDKFSLLLAIADALVDQDWDVPEESDYLERPIVMRVMLTLDPDFEFPHELRYER